MGRIPGALYCVACMVVAGNQAQAAQVIRFVGHVYEPKCQASWQAAHHRLVLRDCPPAGAQRVESFVSEPVATLSDVADPTFRVRLQAIGKPDGSIVYPLADADGKPVDAGQFVITLELP